MRLCLIAAVIVLAGAAPAAADVRTVADVHTPTRASGFTRFPVIDAFRGRVVWSDYDRAIDAWRLIERVGGVTRALPVGPRPAPFDVDLGPDGEGGTLAVYSRCRRRIPLDLPAPEPRGRRYGCDVFTFSFATGRERRVRGPGDEVWPAVWGRRLAFVRFSVRRRGRFGYQIPRAYWRSRRAHRLRLPATPRGQRAVVEGLDMRSRTVAYRWAGIDAFSTYSFIYRTAIGGRPRAASRGAWFGGGAADSLRMLTDPALGSGGVDWLFRDRNHPGYRAAFIRRHGRRGPQASTPVTRAVAFAHDGGTAYWIQAGPGNDPEAEAGGTFPLRADDAVRYRPAPRSWLAVPPARSD